MNRRVIYKFALDRLPWSKLSALYAAYTKFKKQHGLRSTLERTVIGKRQIQYEKELAHDGRNYDVWFDYACLEDTVRTLKEEGKSDDDIELAIGQVREVYEQAVSQVPPGSLKRHWRRYIFYMYIYMYNIIFEVEPQPLPPNN